MEWRQLLSIVDI